MFDTRCVIPGHPRIAQVAASSCSGFWPGSLAGVCTALMMEHLLSLINVHHGSETAGLHVPSITQPQHRNPSWSLQSLSQNVNHYLSFIMTVRICLFESLHFESYCVKLSIWSEQLILSDRNGQRNESRAWGNLTVTGSRWEYHCTVSILSVSCSSLQVSGWVIIATGGIFMNQNH